MCKYICIRIHTGVNNIYIIFMPTHVCVCVDRLNRRKTSITITFSIAGGASSTFSLAPTKTLDDAGDIRADHPDVPATWLSLTWWSCWNIGLEGWLPFLKLFALPSWNKEHLLSWLWHLMPQFLLKCVTCGGCPTRCHRAGASSPSNSFLG